MLSQWWIIWVGNTFPQGDAGLLRLLAARNDLGPAPSRKESTQPEESPPLCSKSGSRIRQSQQLTQNE